MPELYLETAILVIMVATGITALSVRDLLAAVLLFSAFSFFAVLLYVVLTAPDVAFTEAVIGVIATVFFLAALREIGRGCSE
jgi:energy-converting hydrogenase B subunit D